MALTLYINYIAIDATDIIEWPSAAEAMAFEGCQISPEEMSFTLDNTDNDYDDRYSTSIFYGTSGYGLIVQLYDSEVGRYTFEGKIKQLTIEDSSRQCIVEAVSYLAELSDRNCQYTNWNGATWDQLTPAEIIYDILTGDGGIPEANVVYSGFQHAINVQAAATVYARVTFEDDDDSGSTNDKSCADVINELLRIGHLNLYSRNNLICIKLWEEYAGEIAASVFKHNIIQKTYKHYYSADDDPYPIYNSAVVYYDAAGVATPYAADDDSSIALYGEKRFLIPDIDMDTADSTEFSIILDSLAAATWCAATALSRYKRLMRVCEFQTDDSLEFIHVGDQLDLRFAPYNGEPVMILDRDYNRQNEIITWKCLFLNTPYQVYARDYEPPAAPEIIAAIPVDGGILLKWTLSLAADHAGYKIYFTTTPGMWRQEMCHRGQSPIDNKNTSLTPDGYVYAYVLQLDSNVRYYFKVTDYDTSYNESGFSNRLDCVSGSTVAGYKNDWYVQGDAYVDSITLDLTNSLHGVTPADVDPFPYSFPFVMQPAAMYESSRLYNPDGWNYITVKLYGYSVWQYRSSADGTTWGTWSAENSSSGKFALDGSKYIQYRFVFRSEYWADNDYAYIKDVA